MYVINNGTNKIEAITAAYVNKLICLLYFCINSFVGVIGLSVTFGGLGLVVVVSYILYGIYIIKKQVIMYCNNWPNDSRLGLIINWDNVTKIWENDEKKITKQKYNAGSKIGRQIRINIIIIMYLILTRFGVSKLLILDIDITQ